MDYNQNFGKMNDDEFEYTLPKSPAPDNFGLK